MLYEFRRFCSLLQSTQKAHNARTPKPNSKIASAYDAVGRMSGIIGAKIAMMTPIRSSHHAGFE